MIYVRYRMYAGWRNDPEYTVLSITGPEPSEIDTVAKRWGIALQPARGVLGDETEVDYLDAGDWSVRQLIFFRRDLRAQYQATVNSSTYNIRTGSPELSIAPPAISDLRPWIGATLADIFEGLRTNFLEGSIAEGTIEKVRELIMSADGWSRTALEDVLLLLMTAVRRVSWVEVGSYLGRFGFNGNDEANSNFSRAARAATRLSATGSVDETLRRWHELVDQFRLRGWTKQLSALSLEPFPGPEHLAWLLGSGHHRVLEYLQVPEMSLDELRDLMTQEPPDGYSLLRVLSANSAFKVVYLARDPHGREVVLKRYKWGSKEMEDLAKRLATSPDRMIEKDTLSDWMGDVRHPHIQPCMLVRNARRVPFILEPRLDRTLDDPSVGSLLDLPRMLHGVFDAVAYLHGKRVVHTDIKPDNIGVRNGEAILLDFGIATIETTATKANPGSIKTRAPELFGSAVVPTSASDVWALGATVMAVVSGGDYPLLSRDELKDLPPAQDPRRTTFEERILSRIEAFRGDPKTFEEHISRSFPSRAMPLCELAIRACRIEPHTRPRCDELLPLLS